MTNYTDQPVKCTMENESTFLERLGIYFLVFLLIGSCFEIGLLVYGYLNADKVECNLLWCTFTTERTSLNHYMSSSSECYVNGVKVNCSDFPSPDYEHFCNNGTCSMDGVCPYGSNMTVEDCIKQVEGLK